MGLAAALAVEGIAGKTTTGREPVQPGRASGLEGLLGAAAWQRLPPAVRARFAEPAVAVDYVGEFEIVRASAVGRVLAWVCQLIGTPVVARTGTRVPAVVRVGPRAGGVEWKREYRFRDGSRCLVSSTKMIGRDGGLIEQLPCRLCMPLEVRERAGVLHFVSRGYYFRLGSGRGLRLWLPAWLSPGLTHVEHQDESGGWFRFTMSVRHPLYGELYYQTGRFRAAGG
jgi:hypothetical protein